MRVVPAMLVRTLGVGARRTTTDGATRRCSAKCLAASRPSVHVPTDVARQRRSMCAAREQLVATRTGPICSVRGWMRTQLLKIRSGEMSTFPKRVRDAGLTHKDGIPEYIERLLKVIESMNEQIMLADKELAQLVQQTTCRFALEDFVEGHAFEPGGGGREAPSAGPRCPDSGCLRGLCCPRLLLHRP